MRQNILFLVMIVPFTLIQAEDNQKFVQQSQITQRYRYDQNKDTAIQKKIKQRLGRELFSKSYNNIEVRVFQGEVTLSGITLSKEEKNEIVQIVKEVPGVKKIKNLIEVSQFYYPREKTSKDFEKHNEQSKTQEEDFHEFNTGKVQTSGEIFYYPQIPLEVLKQKIRDRLQGNKFEKKYDQVKVSSDNETIILTGTVDTEEDEQEIIKRIQEISGVNAVDNQIQVLQKNREKKQKSDNFPARNSPIK